MKNTVDNLSKSKVILMCGIYSLMYNIKNPLTNIKNCAMLMPTNTLEV